MLVPVHGYKNNFRGAVFHAMVTDGFGGWMCFRSGSIEVKKQKRRKTNEGEKNKKKKSML